MSIRILPYTEELSESVAEFNRRVRPAGLPFRLPDKPESLWLPKTGDRNIYQEVFLAMEDDCVRGAYTFKHQEFSFGGRILPVGACQMPISEGIIDRRYSLVGPQIIHHALRRQPLSYGLGMGSQDASIARMLKAMGWKSQLIPFFFKVRHAFSFLRNIRYLRDNRLRALLLDAAAYSGLGWAGVKLGGLLATGNQARFASVSAEQVTEFSAWADQIWHACRYRYSMVGVRDADVLNILYPPGNRRFIRLKVIEDGRAIGWAVLLDTKMSEGKYFGDMRVGSIVDCLALPKNAAKVMAAADRVLEERNVDLMLSNQSHPAWSGALKTAGFFQGPSNYIFVSSPQLSQLLHEIDPAGAGFHLNRGDGDGPIHL